MKNKLTLKIAGLLSTLALTLAFPACSGAVASTTTSSTPSTSTTTAITTTATVTQDAFISDPGAVVIFPGQSIEVLLTVNGYQLVPTILRAYGGKPQGTTQPGGYTWSLSAGSQFPDGISVDAAGAVTYTGNKAVQAGSFKVQSSDGEHKAEADIPLNIEDYRGGPAPKFGLMQSTRELPAAHIGKTYGATISAFGGTPPYTFTVDQTGVTPPGDFVQSGLRLDAKTGVFWGTMSPKELGKTVEVRILATDVAGITDVHALIYTIHVIP